MSPARLIGAAGLALLAGCTVGPNYRPPGTPTPPAFAEPPVAPPVHPGATPAAGSPAAEPATPPPVDLQNWWQAFDDPELDRLIALALKDNPNVLTAASRIR